MEKKLADVKRVHLVGIGGCSMNGLALILKEKGYTVTGSDRSETAFTPALKEAGIEYYVGHKAEQIGDAELVIYSAAIKEDNEERTAAREKGITEMERSVALGEISDKYAHVVGVAGCHGKTTITSMLARIAEEGALDATVHVGGYVDFLGGGTRIGEKDLFVTEACEYVESFLTLHPTIAIINNIDDDHLDYYRDIEHITDAFRKFLDRLPKAGMFFACIDDPRVKALANEVNLSVITYGRDEDADFCAKNFEYDESGNVSFELFTCKESSGRVELGVPGEHNAINALAALAVSSLLGAKLDTIKSALKAYTLTRRRFELYGEKDGVKYYHDYAHHPAEIKATLSAASHCTKGNIYAVFQCNSYTRAKTLFTKDVTCFEDAAKALVADIYPGREVDTGIVHAKDMVNAINEKTNNAEYLPTFADIREYIHANAKAGDIVVTLGSGDVYLQSKELL